MLTILIVILIALLLLGGGGYRYTRGTDYAGSDVLWLVVAIVLIVVLLRVLGVV